jgi:hypothetical protein
VITGSSSECLPGRTNGEHIGGIWNSITATHFQKEKILKFDFPFV